MIAAAGGDCCCTRLIASADDSGVLHTDLTPESQGKCWINTHTLTDETRGFLVFSWEKLASFKAEEDVLHRTSWQLGIQVNRGSLRVVAILFSSGGKRIYLRNSQRNPLQQGLVMNSNTRVIFSKHLFNSMDFLGAAPLQKAGDRAVVASTQRHWFLGYLVSAESLE